MATLFNRSQVLVRSMATSPAARSSEIVRLAPLIAHHLFGVEELPFKPTSSGRLSNTGFIGDKFIKIARPGLFFDNIKASTYIADEGIRRGLPFIQPIAAKDGNLFSVVPAGINGITIPEYLQGSTVTLSPNVAVPPPIDKSKLTGYPIHHALGRHVADYTLLDGFQNRLEKMGLSTADPLTIPILKTALHQIFSLPEGAMDTMSASAIDAHAAACAENLGDDNVSKEFADGLRSGFLSSIYNDLCTTEKALLTFPNRDKLPLSLIPLDPKEANAFWDINKKGQPFITKAFDLDWTAYCPRVKSLGRVIGFNSYQNGILMPDAMFATIQGYTEVAPLNKDEIAILPQYIKLCSIINAVVRMSYFKEQLKGEQEQYTVDKPNPITHLREIKSFEQEYKPHAFSEQVRAMQGGLLRTAR